MSSGRRWRKLLLIAALPLLYLPLRAAEAPPSPPPAGQRPAPAPTRPAGAEEKEPDPVAAEPAPPAAEAEQERVSVDNNLSFPVDI